MLLIMDVGNTNIVIGLYHDQVLVHHWRMKTDRHGTDDEYGMMLRNLLFHSQINVRDINDIIIASVVPPLTNVLHNLCEKYFQIQPLILGPGVKTGLNLSIDNPKELGADRIANAVGALWKYGAPAIIVDFGTATTFCGVDSDGNYLGGAICPGISISAEALYDKTAKLTRVELLKPENIIGKNTVSALQSGIFYGYVGLVDGIVARMKEELPQAKVIATGGLAPLICDNTKQIDEIDLFLTLIGLRYIHAKNRIG